MYWKSKDKTETNSRSELQSWSRSLTGGAYAVRRGSWTKFDELRQIILIGFDQASAIAEFVTYFGDTITAGPPNKAGVEKLKAEQVFIGGTNQTQFAEIAINFVRDIQRDLGSIEIRSAMLITDESGGLKTVRLRAVEGDQVRIIHKDTENWRHQEYADRIVALF